MERKTFKHENALPSLPIPDIEETLNAYSKSQKAILSETDFSEFQKVLSDFKNSGEAAESQKSFISKFNLENYSETGENWLEKLWEDSAYLEFRGPLYYLNIFGTVFQPSDFKCNSAVPADYKSPVCSFGHEFDFNKIARIIYGTLKFWQAIKFEQYEPQVFRDEPMSMRAFKQFFNSAQIPGKEKDEILYAFSTIFEKKMSDTDINQVGILVNGKSYLMQASDAKGRVYSVSQIHQTVEKLVAAELEISKGQVSSENTIYQADLMDRRSVSNFRDNLSEIQKCSLNEMDHCLFVACFDFSTPQNMNELLNEAKAGNSNNRIHNKPYNLIFYKNGYASSYNNHTPCEAIICVICDQFRQKFAFGDKFDPMFDNLKDFPAVKPVDFELTKDQVIFLDKSSNEDSSWCKNFKNELKVSYQQTKFGKNELRLLKIHPGAFCQIAMQLAFWRMHGKTASVYETAQLRRFYNARTETCRTHTQEIVDFVKNFDEMKKTNPTKACKSFIKAHMGYLTFMDECTKFKGFDRHLLALGPNKITEHHTFKLGGGSNSYLSSSSLGSTGDESIPIAGGCAPFRQDGYCCFYSYTNTRVSVCVSENVGCEETDGQVFCDEVVGCLSEIYGFLKMCDEAKKQE